MTDDVCPACDGLGYVQTDTSEWDGYNDHPVYLCVICNGQGLVKPKQQQKESN